MTAQTNATSMTGRTVLVTGGTGGIGRAAAVRLAMRARPIVRGRSPYAFDSLTLSFVPATLVRTIRRTVCCRKVCAWPGIAGCGAADQVPIHFSSD